MDGFHPLNLGRLLMRGRTPFFVPCTALGCLELLSRSNIDVKGMHVVILGNSNTVGMPISVLLRDQGNSPPLPLSPPECLPPLTPPSVGRISLRPPPRLPPLTPSPWVTTLCARPPAYPLSPPFRVSHSSALTPCLPPLSPPPWSYPSAP